jgi:hypothetical protein
MSDHIEHAKLLTEKVLPFVGYGKPEFAALKAAIIMLERAALSAREGGEAVGEAFVTGDGKVLSLSPSIGYLGVRDEDAATGCHIAPVFLHPAQPASQQGEKDFEFGGYCGTCGSPCDDEGRSIHASQQAGQQGEEPRVIGYVERKDAGFDGIHRLYGDDGHTLSQRIPFGYPVAILPIGINNWHEQAHPTGDKKREPLYEGLTKGNKPIVQQIPPRPAPPPPPPSTRRREDEHDEEDCC